MAFSIDEFPYSSEYDSDLRAVLHTVRKVEEHVASYDATIAALQQALNSIQGLYTRVGALESATADLGTIRSNISALQRSLSQLEIKHNRDIADVKNIITQNVNILQAQIDNLDRYTKRLDKKIIEIRTYMDSRFNVLTSKYHKLETDVYLEMERMQRQLNDEIAQMKAEIDSIDTNAINPWHQLEGKISPTKNLNYIYNELADEIVTASEYVKLGYDAERYAEFGLTAQEYAEFGKEMLHFYWKYAPASGYKQELSNVLTDAITFIERTLTADEYTELGLMAAAYTLIDLTADDYYRYGKQSLNSWIESKQKKLVAGKNITIEDNERGDPVISANGIQPFRVDMVDMVMVFSYVESDFIVDCWVDDMVLVFSKIPRELVQFG